MEENVFHQLERRVEEIEKEYGSLENYAMHSTNLGEGHRMRMEEQYSSFYRSNGQVYREFEEMELADLLDYQELAVLFDGEFS